MTAHDSTFVEAITITVLVVNGGSLFVRSVGLACTQSAECLRTPVKPSSSSSADNDLVQRTIDLAGGVGCATDDSTVGSIEIHPLHGSVLGQQYCFQVSTRAGNTYFACRSDDERREWMDQYVCSTTLMPGF